MAVRYYRHHKEPRDSTDVPATRPERDWPYLPEPALVDAVNVALLLDQPLLLTGEPGTGKTQLGFDVARDLGLGEPLKFDTKSTSTFRDLFYYYDALRRFHDAQTKESNKSNLEYITYRALGAAILRANEEAAVAPYLPSTFLHGGKARSLVLIDEIDKAPRDFPNDLLNELENMNFTVPELGGVKIGADPELRPIVIITSNSEKQLPAAFLRRCVYFHLSFPERDRLKQIVVERLGKGWTPAPPLLTEAIEFFYLLRDATPALRKKPSTAELLGWLAVLRSRFEADGSIKSDPGYLAVTLSCLLKDEQDLKQGVELAKHWAGTPAGIVTPTPTEP